MLQNEIVCAPDIFPYSCMQSAEVERLNGVYNKLLKTAGVELIGQLAVLSHIQCSALSICNEMIPHAPLQRLLGIY